MLDLKKKLEDEIAALDLELRVELPREISKARAHGDLSENAEYHAAKERQGIVNMRLGQLQSRLRTLSMVDMARIPRDRVGLGSWVTVLDLTKDEEVTYQLLTSEEADVAQGRISTTSPIGKALLGKQVGDTVKVMIPGGTREMEITKLVTIHDDPAWACFELESLRAVWHDIHPRDRHLVQQSNSPDRPLAGSLKNSPQRSYV